MASLGKRGKPLRGRGLNIFRRSPSARWIKVPIIGGVAPHQWLAQIIHGIPTDESLPNKLCKDCFKKISEIIKFCLTVKENEDELQKHYQNGELQDFYAKILENNINEIEIEPRGFVETCFVKTEDDTEDFEINTNLENKEASDATFCSSDDGIILPSIKKEKEVNDTTDTVTEPNNMQKIKPIKYLRNDSRWRQKLDPDSVEYLKQFTCLMCLKPCESNTDLIDHYYLEHMNENSVGKSYTELKSGGKTEYNCKACEKSFKLKRQILKHVLIHSDDRPLSCKICARTYRTVPEIVRHARAHNGFKYQCPYNCGFTSAYQGAMKEHQSRHLDQYKYNCEICGKGFNTKTWYEQHQNIHKGLKPFVCDICGIGFPMTRYLQHHKYSTHPQSSDLKRYSCIHCDEKCDSAKSLSVHMLEHGIKQETRLLCHFCGKVVNTDYQLQYHQRMHAGIKPYSCPICKKTFAKKYNVQLHMSIHSGEKAHACGRCGKQYSQRSTLLRHLKLYHPSITDGETET